MKNSYNVSSGLTQRLRQLGLTALMAGGVAVAGHAQTLNYTPSLATNVAGTFTDLGATGTVITTANFDDANSTAQDIGFTFNFNGAAFTQFVLNTNGLIRLGNAAPSAANIFGVYENGQTATGVNPITSTSTADVNLIAPFNFDLQSGTGTGGAEYRVSTTGTAPNRVCTIQWKNVQDKSGTISLTQYSNFTFQVKLYESTNIIDFVYGTATPSANTATGRYPTVGIKGSGSASGQDVLANKTSSGDPWSATTFITGVYTSSTHNFRSGVTPDVGRTYRFSPAVANDAGVTAIYTLGKIISPAGLPHTVSARVTNTGTTALTNVAVTLNVTGANTFTNTQTVASLALGASANVTFASYPATMTAGINTVTVSVPADGNNANNSTAQQQLINGVTQSYIVPNQTATGGIGFGVSDGILAAKYTLSAPRTVNSVVINLSSDANIIGRTVYGVVLSSTGAILGRSADYVIATADVSNNKTFTITTPPSVPVGDFYVGLAQTASSTAYFPVGSQTESPTRSGAFYAAPLAGGAAPTDLASQNLGRFMIEANMAAITATSPELMRAVTVYPNPSENGVFNLAIAGANAKQALEVEITNTLGQRVYAGSARDNFTTTLDLSRLATGLYHLKVKNGDEYMLRQISVAK